jgi:hypothetical protein
VWLCSPDRADGKQAAGNARPAHDIVAVFAHHTTNRPPDILFGGIEFLPVGPHGIEFWFYEGDERPDSREAFSRECSIFGVPRWIVNDRR